MVRSNISTSSWNLYVHPKSPSEPDPGAAPCTCLPALLLGSYKPPSVSLCWGCAMPLALRWRFIAEELLGRALELSLCISPSTQDTDVQGVWSRALCGVRTSRTVHSVTGAWKCKVRATTGPVGIGTGEKQDAAPRMHPACSHPAAGRGGSVPRGFYHTLSPTAYSLPSPLGHLLIKYL